VGPSAVPPAVPARPRRGREPLGLDRDVHVFLLTSARLRVRGAQPTATRWLARPASGTTGGPRRLAPRLEPTPGVSAARLSYRGCGLRRRGTPVRACGPPFAAGRARDGGDSRAARVAIDLGHTRLWGDCSKTSDRSGPTSARLRTRAPRHDGMCPLPRLQARAAGRSRKEAMVAATSTPRRASSSRFGR
jgi:hypothetical protein